MKNNRTMVLGIAFVLVLAAFAAAALLGPGRSSSSGSVRVLPASDVEWQLLNPLRGDKSPRAGTLWGDRGAPVPCGFLVKFVDGFSSPPHIHPVTYRGVVVSGLVHNDAPDAAEAWLAPGSFWTQPAGEVHITAAKGSHNVAYIEIEKGPYLVHPAKEAFPRPEEPIKLAPARMQWSDMVAALPGNPGDERIRRALVKLPPGFEGAVRSPGPSFHAVVIAGRLTHAVGGKAGKQVLEPGSYFGSEGAVTHDVSSGEGEDCLVYVRTQGPFEVSARE